MVVGVKKYNPGFLTDDEIVASFCVRTGEFEALLQCLYASTGQSNAHALVVGPRGSGKTHLLLRVAAEVRRDASLAGFYPIVFAEESYEIATIGEFWLECVGRLAEQAPCDERADLRLSYDDLRNTRNDRDLADRCLGTVLDFADRHGKRVVLLVENLNMLFADMGDPDAGWRLRHTLQTEPRVVLLGSATSRFDEMDHPDHALYDLFRVITLHPLDTRECVALWETMTGQPSTALSVRPLEILTGGNPRLLTIVALFGAGRSFRDLTDNVLDLVDDHTVYFKSHLESLPALERRVYLSLARLWKPATAREVADQARLDINRCSALLSRLTERGAVAVVGGTPRRRRYYLSERLYNVYYLLRRDSGSSQAVEALIDFMVCLYSPAELWDAVAAIYRETSLAGADVRAAVARVLMGKAKFLAGVGHADEAIGIYEQIAAVLGPSSAPGHRNQAAVALSNQVLQLNNAGQYEKGIEACDQLLASFGTSTEPIIVVLMAMALDSKGRALAQLGRLAEALDAYDRALTSFDVVASGELDELVADTMHRKGMALMQQQTLCEAEGVFDAIATRFSTGDARNLAAAVSNALLCKATILLVRGENLSDGEFSRLLDCLAEENELRPGFVQVLTLMASRLGLAQALELIQESRARDLLLPLVTALKQELGQETNVAQEVAEVAADVRLNLSEANASIQFVVRGS